MNSERIITYGVEDFIIDDDFRRILKGINEPRILTNLVSAFPEKESEIKFAFEILKALHVSHISQLPQRKDELWNKLSKDFF